MASSVIGIRLNSTLIRRPDPVGHTTRAIAHEAVRSYPFRPIVLPARRPPSPILTRTVQSLGESPDEWCDGHDSFEGTTRQGRRPLSKDKYLKAENFLRVRSLWLTPAAHSSLA